MEDAFDYDAGPLGSPLRLTPRSQASGMMGTDHLAFGAPMSSMTNRTLSSQNSRARSFAQRETAHLQDEVESSDREMRWDTSLHLIRRQQSWNSHSNGVQVPWQTHTSYDRLNWNLESHPPWIAKAPGTFASTFERNLIDSPLKKQPFRPSTVNWDSRFLVANVLSGDPVLNGHRKGLNNRRGTPIGNLSPTRSWAER